MLAGLLCRGGGGGVGGSRALLRALAAAAGGGGGCASAATAAPPAACATLWRACAAAAGGRLHTAAALPAAGAAAAARAERGAEAGAAGGVGGGVWRRALHAGRGAPRAEAQPASRDAADGVGGGGGGGSAAAADGHPQYTRIGRVEGAYAPVVKDVFAVVEVGPHQFKVTTDDLIFVEKLRGLDVNDKIALSRVLLVGTKEHTTVGRPTVPSAHVHAVVEEQMRDVKVHVFKKRRRKHSRRYNAHRQELTGLRIVDIVHEGA